MKNKTSRYGLPLKVEFCSKCVMSNQKPNSSVEFTSSSPKNKIGINIENIIKLKNQQIGRKERKN